MRMWRLVLGVSVLGAGAVAVACSSSSSSGSPAGDDAGDGAVATDDGGGGEAAACTPAPGAMNVETLDAGTAWGCLQTACKTALTGCAADCDCNNAVNAALLCLADAGAMPSAAKQTACFTPPLTAIATNPNITPLVMCLQGTGATTCGTASGGDGGDAGATDAPASDAPASDAPSEGSSGDAATDAPTG
jgi:hypothetical protein